MGIIKDLNDEMKNDPWHVKLRRWLRLQRWLWMCRTRWIWDLDYEHNIFRKLKSTHDFSFIKQKDMDHDRFHRVVIAVAVVVIALYTVAFAVRVATFILSR